MGCGICEEDGDLTRKCSYCGSEFCTEHRLPEAHDCPALVFDDSDTFENIGGQTLGSDEDKEGSRSPTPPGVANVDKGGGSSTQTETDRDQETQHRSVTDSEEDLTEETSGKGDGIPNPRKPTLEHSSPDVAPDGSVAKMEVNVDEDGNTLSSQSHLFTRRRLLTVLGLGEIGGVAFGAGNGWFRGLLPKGSAASTVPPSDDSDAAATTVEPTVTQTPYPFSRRVRDELLNALNQARDSNLSKSESLNRIAKADAEQMAVSADLTPTGDEPDCQGAYQVLYQTWWGEEIADDGDRRFYSSAEDLGKGVVEGLQSSEEYDYSRVFSGFSRVGIGVERDDADRVWIGFWFC